MKKRSSIIISILISSWMFACDPSGGGGAMLPKERPPVNNDSFERFITRNEEGAILDMRMNFVLGTPKDKMNVKTAIVWMIAVMAVPAGEELDITKIDPAKPTTHAIHFNWLNREIPLTAEQSMIFDAPMPFYAPLFTAIVNVGGLNINTFPNDPGVIYKEQENKNATSIEIIFDALIENSTNTNQAGPLDQATAWAGFNAKDDVDLIFFIYTPIPSQDFEWFKADFIGKVMPGTGTVNDILAQVKVGSAIELGRRTITLA